MSANVSLKFFLNEDKMKGDKAKIYLRITVHRKKAEMATAYSLTPAEWDDAKQRARKNPTINQSLSDMEKRLFQIQNILEYEERPVSARALKEIYLGNDKISVYLIEFYQQYLEEVGRNPEMSESTKSIYRQTFNYVKSFVKAQYKTVDIPIKQVDFKFVNNLDLYLLNSNLTRNTISKHHGRFRTLLHRANNEGYLQNEPYKKFRLVKEKVNRVALSESELECLIEHDLGGNESLQKVRDLFVFSAYTGLRYQDAQDLEMKDIVASDSGRKFIRIEQHKTGELTNIPLFQPALDIIERYENKERQITGKVLPRLSNQKLNAYLKTIADLVGINKNLTHHIARHTFASTVLLEQDIPIKIVSTLLGHTNVRQTEVYAKPSNKYMDRLADEIDNKLKKKKDE